jgi:hypothetical protein
MWVTVSSTAYKFGALVGGYFPTRRLGTLRHGHSPVRHHSPGHHRTNQVLYISTRRHVYHGPIRIQYPSIQVGQPSIMLSTPTLYHTNDSGTRQRSAPDRLTINTLPDNVLLGIFRIHAGTLERWHTLVCVCQRWRDVVLASAQHLNLRLLCTENALAMETTDVRPIFPIIVKDGGEGGIGNIIEALEQSDRVSEVSLANLETIPWRRVVEIMSQGPFPHLTSLELGAKHETPAILTEAFLGGSAPRLQKLDLKNIPFPALPKLLLSATDLVHLRLWDVPDSAYISPDAMVTGLSLLTSLEAFHLGFRSPRPPPDPASRHPPSPTRIILPALTHFVFRGNSEYFDDLVAGVDVPLLDSLSITFFNQLVFDRPQFSQFISRAGKLSTLNQANIRFHGDHVALRLSPQKETVGRESVTLVIRSRDSFWQRLALAQLLCPPLPPLSTLDRLDIFEDHSPRSHCLDSENTEWLELLRPFIAVKYLYLSEELAPRIVPALQELIGDGERELLPALQSLSLEARPPSGPIQEVISEFVKKRRQSGHHIAARHGDRGDRAGMAEGQ